MNSALRRKSLKDDALAAVMRAGWAMGERAREGRAERGALCAAERGIAWKTWKHARSLARSSNEKGNPHERKRGTDHGWNTAMRERERETVSVVDNRNARHCSKYKQLVPT